MAQEQIDVYDPNSQYHVKHKELVIAVRSNNIPKEKELDEWFKTNYPLLSARYK